MWFFPPDLTRDLSPVFNLPHLPEGGGGDRKGVRVSNLPLSITLSKVETWSYLKDCPPWKGSSVFPTPKVGVSHPRLRPDGEPLTRVICKRLRDIRYGPERNLGPCVCIKSNSRSGVLLPGYLTTTIGHSDQEVSFYVLCH